MILFVFGAMMGASLGTVIAALLTAGGGRGVTRCRNCRQYGPDGSCMAFSADPGAGPGLRVYMRPGDFCSYAETMEEMQDGARPEG